MRTNAGSGNIGPQDAVTLSLVAVFPHVNQFKQLFDKHGRVALAPQVMDLERELGFGGQGRKRELHCLAAFLQLHAITYSTHICSHD